MTSSLLIFLTLSLVAGIMLLAFISAPKNSSKARAVRRNHGGLRLSRTETAEKWAVIEAMSHGGGNGLRQALTDADKLLDNVLRTQGFAGDTMGERLKHAKSRFSNYAHYDGAWRAHKVRNALVHEVGFDLVPSQAKEALADFKTAIQDLGGM
jgi:hypothetical protein